MLLCHNLSCLLDCERGRKYIKLSLHEVLLNLSLNGGNLVLVVLVVAPLLIAELVLLGYYVEVVKHYLLDVALYLRELVLPLLEHLLVLGQFVGLQEVDALFEDLLFEDLPPNGLIGKELLVQVDHEVPGEGKVRVLGGIVASLSQFLNQGILQHIQLVLVGKETRGGALVEIVEP